MRKIKECLKKVKDYLSTTIIYYQVAGSDKKYTIIPLTYMFFKRKIFNLYDVDENSFKIKDNISYIHFYKSLRDISKDEIIQIFTPINTEVVITIGEKSNNFEVYNCKSVTIINEDNIERDLFKAEITNAKEVKYEHRKNLTVNNAQKTILYGTSRANNLIINSSSLELNNFHHADLFNYINYDGDSISFNSTNCFLFYFETNAQNIKAQHSNIKNWECKLKKSPKLNFVNSTWKLNTYLRDKYSDMLTLDIILALLNDKYWDKSSVDLEEMCAKHLLTGVEVYNEGDISTEQEEILNNPPKRKGKNLVKKREIDKKYT